MTSVTVTVTLTIRRRGGRKQIIGPDGAPVRANEAEGVASTQGDPALVKALARAFRWRRMLEEGRHGSIRELAAAERVEAMAGETVAAMAAEVETAAGKAAGWVVAGAKPRRSWSRGRCCHSRTHTKRRRR